MKIDASFVIPVYNGQAFLAQTLESCVGQTAKKFEIVVVDDGSTDNTKEIIEFFRSKDERVKPVYLEKNAGRSNARNVGISNAKSDIILTLDADDLNIPDRVEKTLKFFKKNPGVDICYSKFHYIDEWGNIFTFKKNGVDLAEVDAFPVSLDIIKKDPNHYTGICHSSMSFRKKVFDVVKYTDGDYCKHAIDDWKFQVDALKAGFSFSPINRCLVQYRSIVKKRDESYIKELKKKCLD